MGRLTLQVEIEEEFKRLSTTTTGITSIRDITYISPPSRIRCVNMSLTEDQKTAILRYSTKDRGPGMPQLERRVLIDEAIW